ncbi:MAG: class B sortase [Lachnospiraceae bacterium]|jgi:sortase B|nr:class B sortase [Lachnospiraceae bacterium]RKJ49441.1 SrtB family sortase [bacterium 1XD42-54]
MSGKKRKKTFGDVLSTLLMLVALGVFVFSAYTLYGFYQEYRKSSVEYDNLENDYASVDEADETEDFDALEDDKTVQDLQNKQNISGKEVVTVMENGKQITVPTMRNPIDFTELKQKNEDIVGWLRIRALGISYPVVQGEDNDFYLHRTFEKEDNFAGCIFVNCDNSGNFTDQNTIIYGHNMKDGSMFGKLKKFREEGVFDKSKYFWMFTPDLIYEYRIFSATVVDKTGITYQSFFTQEDFDTLMQHAFETSVIDGSDVDVNMNDRIMTLSTCTGDDATRFVVMGKLVQIYASKK